MGTIKTLTWRDVLDAYKLPTLPYFEKACVIARNTGYKYMAFNGCIYCTNATSVHQVLGTIEDLENGRIQIANSLNVAL